MESACTRNPLKKTTHSCLGQFALWRKELVAATSPTTEGMDKSSAVESSAEMPDGGMSSAMEDLYGLGFRM